jgi:GTP diphosphokinase / guanosine-3',5'-bis(diphosphate) 3'-diphosphatase
MMRQYELVERVQKYKPDANEALLNKAYVYAMQKHGQQKRASGDPYISHPLEVAAILTDMHLDESTIAVALLHDTIEDTTATRAEIDELFGEDIGRLVEGLTKLKRLDLVSKKAKQAENLRKLLLAISDDVRVLLVKLADRLHNMRTLDHMKPEQKARISEETMDIYAPLAGRMGMQDMRDELEDLSFRHINPEAYETVTQRLAELSARNEGLIKKIEDELRELLLANGLEHAFVKGRQKKPYSVFRKMQSKSLSFEQLSDVYGFRIIVDDTACCYKALGIVHTRWRVVPGRFKDYISNPKQNDYRSLHTTIVGPSRQRIELQIRTELMQEIAEYGIAAHALYKDGRAGAKGDELLPKESNAYSWLRHTIESLAEGDSPEEFLEHTKLELFQDQVFCFTPKGKLIALPRGATPIDFAYAVHTNIGDTTVGAKINGRIMPLVTRLNNGDEVEIIRSGVQVPPAAWEEIVVTGKARSAIRRATRMAIRKQYAGLGHRILERTFERAGKVFSRDALKPALHRLAQKDVEDAIASVGRGELSSLDVLRAVFPDYKDERVTVKPSADQGWFNMPSASGMMFKLPAKSQAEVENAQASGLGAALLPIRGLSSNTRVRFAPSGAVPGDRIVGIMQEGKGITIYPIQAPALQKFDDEPERWIDVRWDLDEANKSRFPAKIEINTINEPGTLATVAKTIGALDINIRTMSMGSNRADDFSEIAMEIEVWDLRQLNQLLSQLKELDCVANLKRVYD